MSKQPTEAEAAVLSAVDTLLKQIETEQGWIDDLKTALEKAETKAGRLMTSVDAAMHTLPVRLKRDTLFRLRRMRAPDTRTGRPARDGRQTAMLHFLAERGEGTITTAEMRLHLKDRGLRASPQYVSNQMVAWVREGLLHREAHGVYRIDPQAAALRSIRFRKDREAMIRQVRADLRNVREGLEKRPIQRPISDWIDP